ncbi:hypothetical protein C8Q76DRAFT_69011 [Earliella scabrosa]|nr:hypothetical protein C8Q76DRAFT_69011 [Earliella scabrosa]
MGAVEHRRSSKTPCCGICTICWTTLTSRPIHTLQDNTTTMATTVPTREAILAQLEHVYDQQRNLREEEIRLKGLLNAMLPVNRIPAEILAHIFTLRPSPATGRDRIGWDSSESDKVSSLHWLHLTLVCRYWRDIARGMPGMWRAVDVGSTPFWLVLCLEHSAQCTLDLAFHSLQFAPENFKTLLPHRHRIRSLWFKEVDETWEETLCSLLRDDMTALETLRYPRKWSKRRASECSAELNLTHQQHPLLKAVTLVGTTIPCDPLIYTKLVSIDFESCKCNIPFLHFVELLKASTNMRTISLSNFLNQLGKATARKPSQDLVTLSHIHDITLNEDLPEKMAALLSYFHLPNIEYLAVNGEKAELGRLDGLTQLLPSDAAPCLPKARDIIWLSLTVYEGTYELEGYCDRQRSGHVDYYDSLGRPPPRPTVELSIYTDDLDEPEALPMGLVDLVNLFQGAPVTYLSITGEHGAPTDSAHWAAVFRAFPKLEELVFDWGRGMTKALWEGLLHASLTALEAGGLVVCRALRHIRLNVDDSFTAPEDLLETIVECLRVRAALGGTRLQQLYLNLFHEDDEEYEAMHATFMPQLKALVIEEVIVILGVEY